MAKGDVMSRLTSLTIAFAAAVFLSVPHLATAAEDDQRARARTRGPGRTASAPAQTSRGGSRRAPSVRSSGRATRSAPARRAPTTRSGQSGRTASPGARSGAQRSPATRNRGRVTRGARAARPGTEAPRETSRQPSRRAPIVRNGGRSTTVEAGQRSGTKSPTRSVKRVTASGTRSTASSTRTRQRAPASSGVTRTTQGRGRSSRAAPQRRVVGAAGTSAAGAGSTVRRRPSRIVEVDGTRQSDPTRNTAVRVGSSTRTRSGVRNTAVTSAGSVADSATARPNRRPPGPGNVVGTAVPRATQDGTFRGSVGSGGRGSVSGRGTTSNYGYRYPYDGGRVRFGRSTGYYGRGRYRSHSYGPRFYGASYYPRYGFNFGVRFGSGSAFGHYGYRSYGYPGYGYSSYGYPYYPYGYTSYGYGQNYVTPYMGSLRLKVKPRDAEVFVDGYYVGLVDHFDGFTQRLRLEEGTYQIQISHPDYLPIDLDVLIVAGETVTFEELMVRP